jgi:hypothetical protein
MVFDVDHNFEPTELPPLEPPEGTDDGWDVGEVQLCESPLTEPTYTDSSSSFGYSDADFPLMNIEGAIAIQDFEDDWWIWQIGDSTEQSENLHVFGWNSAGEHTNRYTSSIPTRLYIWDADGNGEDDLFITGEFLEIYWSVLTDHEIHEVLLENEAQRGVRDAGLIDVDGDGDLDLWALVAVGSPDSNLAWAWMYLQESPGVFAEPYEFVDPSFLGASFEAVTMDWDGDSDLDFYFCNDFGFMYGGNGLLLNDGEGNFSEGDANGSDVVTACMSTSVADINQDRKLDLYLTAAGGHHYLQQRNVGFVDVTTSINMPKPPISLMLWGGHVIDYNNDGFLDIFAGSSGFTRFIESDDPDIPDSVTAERAPIWLIKQTSIDNFEEIGAEIGLPQETVSRATLAYDLNKDGVVDLIAGDAARLAHVFLSDGCTANNWISIEAPDNSIVRVVAEDQVWTMLLTRHPGMASSMPPVAHIGLGNIGQVDWIEVEIPWVGTRYLLGPIETRRRLKFVEP